MRLKDLIPPIVVRAARRQGRLYAAYKDAIQACGESSYQQEALVNIVHEKTKRYRDRLGNERPVDIDLSNLQMALAISVAGTNREIRVLDFGGACGAHYFLARSFLGGSQKLRWCVVETERMIEKARDLENGELRFFSDVQAAIEELGQVDLLFSATALQYCEDPYESLRRLVDCRATYLVLTRLLLTSGNRDLICVQRSKLSANGPGPLPKGMRNGRAMYPVTAMRRDLVEGILKDRYRLRARVHEIEDVFCLGGHWTDFKGYFAEAC